ncbi:MAG: hypothetical protein KJO50_11540, partial [Bacteroidia bacterium]|nr:hypothetical protein [Bacteroidia bacterium]
MQKSFFSIKSLHPTYHALFYIEDELFVVTILKINSLISVCGLPVHRDPTLKLWRKCYLGTKAGAAVCGLPVHRDPTLKLWRKCYLG